MVATVQISETNGAGATVTDNVANMNYGSTDAPALNPVTFPIAEAANSFEKYNRLKAQSGTFNTIDNLRVFRSSGALADPNVTQKGNQVTAAYSAAVYAQPVSSVSAKAVNVVPTSAPGTANLGIAGSLTGQITAVGQYSDYWVTQIQTSAGAAAGETTTLRWQYDEVA